MALFFAVGYGELVDIMFFKGRQKFRDLIDGRFIKRVGFQFFRFKMNVWYGPLPPQDLIAQDLQGAGVLNNCPLLPEFGYTIVKTFFKLR